MGYKGRLALREGGEGRAEETGALRRNIKKGEGISSLSQCPRSIPAGFAGSAVSYGVYDRSKP